jgi:hypothetical protein
MYFDNVLEVTAEAIIDDEAKTLRSQDSHRVYIEKELVYYQWKGKDLIVDWENELSEDLENVIPNFNPDLINSVALATAGSPVTTDGRNMTICYNETGTKKFELQINYKNVLDSVDANGDQILDITNLQNLYGKDINESYVAVEKLRITSDMVQVYVKKNNTLKVTLPNKVTIMFFDADQELCDKLRDTKGYIEMNIVGIPKRNEYMGWVSAQILVTDYEITGESKYNF